MYMVSALSCGPVRRKGLLAWRMEQLGEETAVSGSIELLRTSRKPAMNVFGNLALGSSSARKYLSTCVSCFQKLSVSCCKKAVSVRPSATPVSAFYSSISAYLELSVAVVDEDICGPKLGDVAVALELLPHLGADSGDWDVERVHGLDLGGLGLRLASVWQSL